MNLFVDVRVIRYGLLAQFTRGLARWLTAARSSLDGPARKADIDRHLDRISLDGVAVRRLSATLHLGPGDHPGTSDSRWWVYLACERISTRFVAGPTPVVLDADLIDGQTIHANVRIVGRRDDAYGTELILAAIDPVGRELT